MTSAERVAKRMLSKNVRREDIVFDPFMSFSYEFLLFLEESTRDNQQWMAFTGASYYQKIKTALLKKTEQLKKQGTEVFLPKHLM